MANRVNSSAPRGTAMFPKEIKKQLRGFNVGDEVLLPKSLTKEDENGKEKAIVYQVCTHHIVFQLKNGRKTSLSNNECMQVELIRSANVDMFGPSVTLDTYYDSFK